MRYKGILFLIFFIISPQLSMGQVEEVDEKVKKKSERKLNKKIDNGIDKGLEALEGLFGKKKKRKKNQDDTSVEEDGTVDESTNPQKEFGGFGGIFKPAKVEDSYLFKGSVKMEVVSTSKKGKEEIVHYNMLIPSDPDFMGFSFEDEKEQALATTIWDFKNESMVTMMENEKGERSGIAIAMKKDMIEAAMERAEAESEDQDAVDQFKNTFAKTGKTKEILGYTCIEYKGTHEDGVALVYFAEEDILDSHVFLEMFKSLPKTAETVDFGDVPKGFMMEMISTHTDGSGSHMLVKEIENDAPFTMVAKDYKIMDMQEMMNRR